MADNDCVHRSAVQPPPTWQNTTRPVTALPQRLEPEPGEALDARRNDQGEVEVLVKWERLPEFENSWEIADKMR
ncbi:hypothetical protein L195_g062095, partial [Trifolium pratense]